MLLSREPKELDQDLEFAADRFLKHLEMEEERRKEGLKTDMQRFLNGERITD